MLIALAWKNIWRNRSRSLVITTAVALGLWGGIFSDAFMQGMTNQQIYAAIHNETGHLQLNRPGFLVNHDMQLFVPDADKILDTIRQDPDVSAAAGRLQVTAMVSTASASAGILLNGIDTGKWEQVSNLPAMKQQGDFLAAPGKGQAFIGQELAKTLHCKINSRILLTLQTMSGEITYASLKVTGIYKTQNSEFDKQMVWTRRQELATLLGFPENSASLLTVILKKDSETDPARNRLSRLFPSLQVQSWVQLSPMLQVLTGTMRQTTLIFVGIILIALAFGIINTMLMAVMDRTREIGMLLSIGMSRKLVFAMIILETIFLSVTGAVIGVLLSIVTIAWTGKTGIHLTAWAEGINAWGYSSVVYPALGADFYVALALMVIGIALLAGIFPARRALRLRPADAVRGD